MTSPGCVRRVSRAAGFAAAALVVAAPAMAASAAPSGPTGSAAAAGSTRGADHGCDPDASRDRAGGTTGIATARLDRAADQRDYTPHDLRRIDRRLDRALARAGVFGARSGARFGLALRIPVHAHVVDGDRSRGPSRRAVDRQLAVLNRAYDGGQSTRNTATRFRFHLASFDRTRNQRWYTASMFDEGDRQLRRSLHRGGPESLNLYFSAPRSPQTDTVVLGWSSVPWLAQRRPLLDGVTVHQDSLPGGDLERYDRGDTAVHEVGHWLGLFHTFQGGCSARNDRVDDTPAEAEPSLACEVARDTCEAEGTDPVRNFMNYSLDSCMNMFTPGQVARMTDNWLAYRTP